MRQGETTKRVIKESRVPAKGGNTMSEKVNRTTVEESRYNELYAMLVESGQMSEADFRKNFRKKGTQGGAKGTVVEVCKESYDIVLSAIDALNGDIIDNNLVDNDGDKVCARVMIQKVKSCTKPELKAYNRVVKSHSKAK